ncbi:MAG: GNAT family N-acetyltransferase [Anaerolineaceae bacterium]|nr:GNAT family N-acetyltransferase [Anaerolineaceae bacterium]
MRPTVPPFLIREALSTDIAQCLELDHHYETERVWQMSVQPDTSAITVNFRTERLPRAIDIAYEVPEDHLKNALIHDNVLLVAELKDEPTIIGYLVIHREQSFGNVVIKHIVVDDLYRRLGVGRRLLTIAQRWALEHDIRHLFIETQTQNYPSIQFCQSCGFTFCGFNDQLFPNNDIGVYFGKSAR